MKKEVTFCDSCGAQMTNQDIYNKDVFGIVVDHIEPAKYLYITKNTKTSCGSSSKGAYMRGTHFCGEACFARELTAMLRECHLKLQVTPVLAVAA